MVKVDYKKIFVRQYNMYIVYSYFGEYKTLSGRLLFRL